MKSRGSFIAGLGGGATTLLLAGCAGGSSGSLVLPGSQINASRRHAGSYTAAYAVSFTAGTQSGTVYADSTQTHLWGGTDSGSISFTGTLSPSTGGGTQGSSLAWSITSGGNTHAGSIQATLFTSTQATFTHSDGSVVNYSYTSAASSGSGSNGSASWNLSSEFNSTTTGLASTITGAMQSKFNRTDDLMQGGGGQCHPICYGPVSDGAAATGFSFGAAGLILEAIGIAVAPEVCAVIAIGFGVWAYYHPNR